MLIKNCKKMKNIHKMSSMPWNLLANKTAKNASNKTTTTTTTSATIKTTHSVKYRKEIPTTTTPTNATLLTSLLSSPLPSLLQAMPAPGVMWQVFISLILLLLHQPICIMAGSCREAQLCCNGRDSSCVVQKAPINAIIEDLSDKPCYCDHACLKLGDCCTDFKDHCGVLDCQVSDWGQWSDCSTACGSGTMTRTRQVKQPAQNGGKHCPVLLQKRGCQGFRCHGHHDKKILRETALLLPASLTHHYHLNDSKVRRNLRAHYRDTYQHNREQEYCVEFEVLRTSKTCHKLPPYNLLIEGDRIVVRCDIEAFVQDFTDNNLTATANKFKHHNETAMNKFDVANTSSEEDMNDSDENMIDNSSSSSSSSSSASEEHDDYDTATLTLKTLILTTTTTSTTSTTTTTTPYPPPPPIQYHCRGEGLPGRTTRWSALAAPSCRGKWLRLTLDLPKKCTQPQFMFV